MHETRVPRVYLVRPDGPELTEREREHLRAGLRAASRNGPVAVVLDLGPRAAIDASDAAWWLGMLDDREADLAVVAVVSEARSLRLAILAFSALVSLRHLPAEVKALPDHETAIGWAAGALARAAAARLRASQAPLDAGPR